MLRGNYNERYEEDSLRISASVINEVKSKLPLDEYLKSQSALSSSFSEINNGYNGQENNLNNAFSGNMSDNNNSNGYANQNQRVLVRKMDNPSVNRYVNNNPVDQYNNGYQQNNNNYGSNEFDFQRNNPFNSGISHVLTLIFAIVLIALVIMVSLFIMRSIGI